MGDRRPKMLAAVLSKRDVKLLRVLQHQALFNQFVFNIRLSPRRGVNFSHWNSVLSASREVYAVNIKDASIFIF